MTLKELETIRETFKAQYETHLKAPPAPGQDTLKHVGAIEILAGIKTLDQLINQERASLVKPPGATGPVLVGV